MRIITRLSRRVRHLRIVVSILVLKIMKYSSMAAPIHASWGLCTDSYYNSTFDQQRWET